MECPNFFDLYTKFSAIFVKIAAEWGVDIRQLENFNTKEPKDYQFKVQIFRFFDNFFSVCSRFVR